MAVPVAPAATGLTVEQLNQWCEERFDIAGREIQRELATLREMVEAAVTTTRLIIDERDHRYEARFQAQERAAQVALEAAHAVLVEHDKRYEQRFQGQESNTVLALSRVDKEFHEHLQQVRTETHAALDAADKAITKSEKDVEKRFDAVNEFRAQLADQAGTFMTRTESLQRHEQNADKLDSLDRRTREDLARVNSRLDLTAGASSGLDKSRQVVAWGIAALAGLISIVVAFNAYVGK